MTREDDRKVDAYAKTLNVIAGSGLSCLDGMQVLMFVVSDILIQHPHPTLTKAETIQCMTDMMEIILQDRLPNSGGTRVMTDEEALAFVSEKLNAIQAEAGKADRGGETDA